MARTRHLGENEAKNIIKAIYEGHENNIRGKKLPDSKEPSLITSEDFYKLVTQGNTGLNLSPLRIWEKNIEKAVKEGKLHLTDITHVELAREIYQKIQFEFIIQTVQEKDLNLADFLRADPAKTELMGKILNLRPTQIENYIENITSTTESERHIKEKATAITELGLSELKDLPNDLRTAIAKKPPTPREAAFTKQNLK